MDPDSSANDDGALNGSASAPSKAIELTTVMTLAANTKILVTCRSGIKLQLPDSKYPVILSAKTPTSLIAPTVMALSPAASLEPEFAIGWRKLPDELQIRVLSYNLTTPGKCIRMKSLQGQRHGRIRWNMSFSKDIELCDHLAMGPDISRLAYDTFYNQNRFLFRGLETPDEGYGEVYGCMWFPPQAACRLIRRVYLSVGMNVDDLESMRGISEREWGFENTREVRINFEWRREDCANDYFPKELEDDPLSFPCEGAITFDEPTHDAWEDNMGCLKRVKRRIRRNITFTG